MPPRSMRMYQAATSRPKLTKTSYWYALSFNTNFTIILYIDINYLDVEYNYEKNKLFSNYTVIKNSYFKL